MARGRSDDWTALQRRSHLPEAQDAIREAVRAGKIRIAPLGGGRVRIIPLDLSAGRRSAARPPAATRTGMMLWTRP